MDPRRSEGGVKAAVLLVATLASFLTPFMGSSVNIALPSVGRHFGMDAVSLSWVATAYLLAAAVFLVPFGKIADIYGRKRVFTLGMTVYTVSSLFLALSPSAAMLIAFRVVQGIGSAMIFGTAVAMLTSVFPPQERGRALGVNVAAVYLGLSLGPFLGGLLTEHFGWRSVFWFNVPLGLLIIAAVFWKLKAEWAEARGERFDLGGSLVYGAALVALMYGFSLLPELSGAWLIIAGILGIAAFIWWETRARFPVLDMNLFRNNTVFALSNLSAFINYSATFAVTFLLSLYLQYVKDLTPQSAGLILVAQPAMQAAVSPFAGRVSDRVAPRVIASAGMALTTVGLTMLVFVGQDTLTVFIVVSLIVLGLGFGLFSSPNTNAIMGAVQKRSYGVASGTLATMRMTGQMFSMGIAMLIINIFVGRVEIAPEYFPELVTSMQVAFIAFAALCFGGIFASLARGSARGKSA
jgi:EmrB/QacA subfamily drug resistance transporter